MLAFFLKKIVFEKKSTRKKGEAPVRGEEREREERNLLFPWETTDLRLQLSVLSNLCESESVFLCEQRNWMEKGTVSCCLNELKTSV